MLPNFLIIGAPRAGTSWIAKNLREHPEIFMPQIKELHFFDRDYEKGIEYYECCFADVMGQRAIGEATPNYLHLPQVAGLIYEHLPDAKLIVTLRNPVERLYSRYWNAKAKYSENIDLSFEDKLVEKPSFIEEGFYYDHLMRFYSLFPKERVLVMLYDDLERNPADFLSRIYRFLDVDTGFVSPLLAQKINSASAKKFLGKSKSLWYLYRLLMRMRAFSLAQWVEGVNSNEYPPMKLETRRWLTEKVYRDKNNQLQDLVGIDISIWNRVG